MAYYNLKTILQIIGVRRIWKWRFFLSTPSFFILNVTFHFVCISFTMLPSRCPTSSMKFPMQSFSDNRNQSYLLLFSQTMGQEVFIQSIHPYQYHCQEVYSKIDQVKNPNLLCVMSDRSISWSCLSPGTSRLSYRPGTMPLFFSTKINPTATIIEFVLKKGNARKVVKDGYYLKILDVTTTLQWKTCKTQVSSFELPAIPAKT